jgi:predicted HTH transcriptional regulator
MEREIASILESGENSFVEFKEASVSPQTIAEEIVAFSNVRGGHIFIGVFRQSCLCMKISRSEEIGS